MDPPRTWQPTLRYVDPSARMHTARASAQTPLRLLLIEDDPGDARLVREALTDVGAPGFALEWSDRLSAATDRLQAGGFDAVLLDLTLPDSQGVETVERVLAVQPGVPVVVLSGLDDERVAFDAVQHGAQDYLLKRDVSGVTIARALSYAVERRRVEATLAELRAEQAARVAAEDARAALAASEERYRSLVTFLPLAIIVQARSRVVYANPAAVQLLGASDAAGLVGRPVLDLVHADDRQLWIESLARATAGSPAGPTEIRAAQSDRGFVVIEALTWPLVFEEQPATLSVLRDLTAEKAAAHERDLLARGERLRALGQLASGVAHDLNQALGLVAGYGDLALAALSAPEPNLATAREHLQVVVRAAQDGGETVKRLLTFARGRAGARIERVDLGEVLREVAQLTAPRWRDAAAAENRLIDVHVQVDGTPVVEGEAAALREALTNLLLNALDAMPQGGTVVLFSRDGADDVEVQVVDTGVGMPPEVAARVFEPYYTTKGEHGTGLGLAIVYSIVEQHGGSIEVDSAVGQGTTFRLRLPRTGAASSEPVASPEAEAAHRSLRVLAVDDEPSLARLVEHVLRPQGHKVIVELSAEQALVQLNQGHFDVVVSDLGLGTGMSGWELAERVREQWPSTRFVLVTGWGAALDLADARLHGVDAVVAKPYRAAELVAAVHAAAASSPASNAFE